MDGEMESEFTINCLMITTTESTRLQLLEGAVSSVDDSCGDIFTQKVLSVDILKGHPFNDSFFDRFREAGWDVVVGECTQHRGMFNNICRGLDSLNHSDAIFYCEDDVKITRFPDRDSIVKLFTDTKPKGKDIGFVCYNTHILAPWLDHQPERESYLNDESNYFKVNSELFLLKGEVVKDEYYLNFPASIVRHDLFSQLMHYAGSMVSGQGLEPGITSSWFDLGLDDYYESSIYVMPDTLNKIPITIKEFYHTANMRFRDNDKNYAHGTISRDNTLF